MRDEVHADGGMCDVGHHEPPREILAETQVEAERQPSVGVDGSAVGCIKVVVDPFMASRNEPTGVHTEVGTRVEQESVMKRRPGVVVQTCAAVDVRCVSFPAGGRRRAEYIFRPGSETSVVPVEAGCSFISVGGSAAWAAVPAGSWGEDT
jgi:hypothetical protein